MHENVLKNNGIVGINIAQKPVAKKTILVIGVARGGTSIASGVLNELGVFTGDRSVAPVYEDTRLSCAFENKGRETFEEVIRSYNEEHEVWAWKRPSILMNINRVNDAVRNPHYVFIFRDILSIASRNTISMQSDFLSMLDSAYRDYGHIVNFAVSCEAPALFISSEKIMRHKEEFIETLINFADIKPTPIQIENAKSYMKYDPPQYLDKTRITKAEGCVNWNLLPTGVLKGWAKAVNSDKPVIIEVFINGELIIEQVAQDYREDIKKKGLHPTGLCGFQVVLSRYELKAKDEIRIRTKGETVDLPGSPFIL